MFAFVHSHNATVAEKHDDKNVDTYTSVAKITSTYNMAGEIQ